MALAAMAKLGRLGVSPVLAVEQPELHLHPKAHAEVAALFCELAEAEAARLLVETIPRTSFSGYSSPSSGESCRLIR